jgi:F-type H+-transporting ATPase subunit a
VSEQIPEAVGNLVVMVNSAVVGGALIAAGAWIAHGKLSANEPTRRQSAGEAALSFFVGKATEMAPHNEQRERVIRIVAPFLAAFFMFIIASNLIAVFPFPVINRPPTSHFSVTLTLALLSVLGTLGIAARVRGVGASIKHLFWPNPLQWVSEITDVLSLSLRLFGNIAGEYMTIVLVSGSIFVGIPLILHALGVIPAFVQALVFTLLTSSFIATAIAHEEKKSKKAKKSRKSKAAEDSDAAVETLPAPESGRPELVEEV